MAFAIVTAFLCLITIWLIPKKLTSGEIYTSWGIISTMSLITDGHLGEVLDLYYFFDHRIELIDIVFQLIIPPSIGIIFLNFMPEKLRAFIIYILLGTIFSLVFEYFAVKFHYLNYKRWSLWYSAPAYPLIFLILRYHLFLIRKKLKYG